MSEQKTNYMAQLDAWSDEMIIEPLVQCTETDSSDWETAVEQIKRAIREKTLESYKNGCKAGAGAVRKEMRQH